VDILEFHTSRPPKSRLQTFSQLFQNNVIPKLCIRSVATTSYFDSLPRTHFMAEWRSPLVIMNEAVPTYIHSNDVTANEQKENYSPATTDDGDDRYVTILT